MALLHMLRDRADVHAVTVDHRLREGSDTEARFASLTCRRFGVPHSILARGDEIWNSAADARNGRYAALAGAGRPVVTAHNLDDQAETVRMRVTRGGGTLGLSGIAPVAFLANGVPLLRPLLGASRASLRAYLASHGEAWVEDPSNGDVGRERIGYRNRPLDIDNVLIARLAKASWRFRTALMRTIAADMRERLEPGLYASALSGPPLVQALRQLSAHVGGRAHLPSEQRVETFMRREPALTIAGCVLRRTKFGIAFAPDPRNGLPLPRSFRPSCDDPVRAILAERLC